MHVSRVEGKIRPARGTGSRGGRANPYGAFAKKTSSGSPETKER